MTRFFDYIEIKTKITSLFAFAITLALLKYHQVELNLLETTVFFVSMFLFDLTTTAINNYIDTKTNGQDLQYDRKRAKGIIFIMLGLATALGLYLVYLTDMVILLAGALCFFCGIVYTYGPVAISRIPLGEILSGVFYGFFIPFILIYINMPEGALISYGLTEGFLTIGMNIKYILATLVLAIVPTLTTANIMLANNICDLERDIAVNRFTLVYYIGKSKSVALYGLLYYLSFAGIILMVLLGIAPRLSLLALVISIPLAWDNIKVFKKKQSKTETFITSIKNYILINGLLLLSILMGIGQRKFI